MLCCFSSPTENQDIIRDLLNRLIESINSELVLPLSTENITKDIAKGVLKCSSVEEIIEEILRNIPFELSEEQRQDVKSSAEKLYALEEV